MCYIYHFLQVESEQLLVGFCEHLENEIPEETTEGKEGEDDEGNFRFIFKRFLSKFLISRLKAAYSQTELPKVNSRNI